MLNLVPEYDSGDSDEEGPPKETNELFASAKSQPSSVVVIQPLKAISQGEPSPPANPEQKDCSDEELIASSSTKTQQSFASIITGGRSPEGETHKNELLQEDDELSVKLNSPADNDEMLTQKPVKRKRKIEFSTSKSIEKVIKETSSIETNGKCDEDKAKAAKIAYLNFVKAETEAESQSEETIADNPDSKEACRIEETNESIQELKATLDAKLSFLSQGRQLSDVMPLQVMQIQLQVILSRQMRFMPLICCLLDAP